MAAGTEVSVFDVAKYILELYEEAKELPITTWKLQKLVYYSQAWSTVWDDEQLFPEAIEAWANGPVCRELYLSHVRKFKISEIPGGDSSKLSRDQRETIEEVVRYYGDKSAQYLSELTHLEKPWQAAREGLEPGERGERVITLDSMAEYYGGL